MTDLDPAAKKEFINPENPVAYLWIFELVLHADKITSSAFKSNSEISEVVSKPSLFWLGVSGGVKTKKGSLKSLKVPETSAWVAKEITSNFFRSSSLTFFSFASFERRSVTLFLGKNSLRF
mgnify:CR=1 FL=1